jgi:hypothetical protein
MFMPQAPRRARVLRPQLVLRKLLGQVFGNRQRVPDHESVVDQRRHLAARADRPDTLLELRIGGERVEAHLDFVERDAGLLEQHPGPHRPGRIILVADVEREHAGLPPKWCANGAWYQRRMLPAIAAQMAAKSRTD